MKGIGEMGFGEEARASETGECGKYPLEIGGVRGRGEAVVGDIGAADSDK